MNTAELDVGFITYSPNRIPLYIRIFTPGNILQPFSRPFILFENQREIG